MTEAVAVIGGGISGVQAALDLANAGMRTYLIERSPSLGGHMAQLDKTFPTNDCSACILSPKLVEAYRHPDIDIMTLTQVISLEGESPEFSLTVRRSPRYVDDNKCIGCGICAEKCPVKVPSEFDLGLGERRAIYLPFPQAVPLRYTIDADHCLMLQEGKCGVCQKMCPAEAIDYGMEAREESLRVGAVIVAVGFDQMDPELLREYSYGKHPDIVTALEFERLLSPSGPTGGRLVRPSDGGKPERILFVQCAGSRNVRYRTYCSRFCCMASLKHAMVALEHEPSIKSIEICYMDLRTYGKGFDAYRGRVEESVTFRRGRVAEILPESRPIVRVEDVDSGEPLELERDLIVLAMAAVPPDGLKELCQALNIGVAEDGFVKVGNSLLTERPGVFAAGCCIGPKDIPDSVSEASAAASLALSLFPGRKARTVRPPVLREIDDHEARLGVFVCRCGTNIAGVVDVPAVVRETLSMPGVVHAEENLFTCSEGALEEISSRIKERGLNRVVVAACTPRTHEPLFRDTLLKAGLNPFLLEMVNIRDQCSWVHRDSPQQATRKAIDLVRMGVAKAARLIPLEPLISQMRQSALVIGAGPAGLCAARDLARQGKEVILLESAPEAGGALRGTGTDEAKVVEDLIASLPDGVRIISNGRVREVRGAVGDFAIQLEGGDEIRVGVVIFAVGGEPAPHGLEAEGVITSLELDRLLASNESFEGPVTFIQCVGVRDDRLGCSRFCCRKTMQQAQRLREKGKEVNVLHRDIMTFQRGAEELYTRNAESGVRFIRYEEAPRVTEEGVIIRDHADGELMIPSGLVVLAVGMVPSPSIQELGGLFKVPTTGEGFFLERHPKLAPVEFSVEGLFMAGGCQYPKDLEEAMIQGSAAAAKAAALLSARTLISSPQICVVDADRCRACGRCEELCSYGAAHLEEEGGRFVSHIDPRLCKGCGLCAVSCPSNAITALGFTTEQIEGEIDALTGGER